MPSFLDCGFHELERNDSGRAVRLHKPDGCESERGKRRRGFSTEKAEHVVHQWGAAVHLVLACKWRS
jgi:hypothetical protein